MHSSVVEVRLTAHPRYKSAWRASWKSPQLGVNLYSEVGGPRVGKQVFTLIAANRPRSASSSNLQIAETAA